MNRSSLEKGIISITIIFIIALSFAMAAIIALFWSKAPRAASHLKRLQAINYAEAALYETFNRFRTKYDSWDQWLAPNHIEPANPTITIDGITVTINVIYNPGFDSVDPTDDMAEIFATLDQDDIELEL